MKIAVLGSINRDMTVLVPYLPGKGETIRAEGLSFVPGGKGANQAVAAARLGAEVTLFGCVGDDDNGKALLKGLKEEGVDVSFVKVTKKAPTGLALITVGDEDNTIAVVTGANELVTPEYLKAIKEPLLQADIVVMQLEIPLQTVEQAIDCCKEKGVKTLLNPAPARAVPQSLLQKADYLTPNRQETAMLFPTLSLEQALLSYPEKLIVTLGEEGAAVALKNGEIVKLPARKSKVVDTTGAGDTLNGAFACCIAKGQPLLQALAFANTASGLSVERLGAQGGMPTMAEVAAAI